ncbi:patatin-like phospholipase family protein [Scleromatobacter humisilvae]|uniref:Patatin-like phospholipase family protein n=1 Tax=Scleromatobacter humisilvae TaxID=2897159 RepID=A0A9X1YE59_9BURK|nr:patatin-like phospholipase family protein [Scleromatobacter humisilvae]MCK9684323.1 patatin-like phospholipase family protein [Scleromatobacter humisilvae]
MANPSLKGAAANLYDNVSAALLREYLYLGKITPSQRIDLRNALANYRQRRRTAVEADPEWLRSDQDLLQFLYESIHSSPERERPTALCFSGGGIRSATFCLGVLQGLARQDRLHQFRYLSSVSGGGYIASWLTSLLGQKGATFDSVTTMLADTAGGSAPAIPPGPARDPMTGGPHDAISRLRAYSNYLSPVLGLSGDMLALIATFVRNLVLNLCVWLPLMATLLLLPRIFVLWMLTPPAQVCVVYASLAAAILLIVWGVAYMVADMPSGIGPGRPVRDRFTLGCFIPVTLAAFLFSLVGVWGDLWSASAWWPGVAAAAGAGANLVGICLGLLLRKRRPNAPFKTQGFTALLLIACGAVGGIILDLALSYAHHQLGKAQAPALLYATVSVPLMLGCFWAQITLCVGITARWTDENMREWWSRASGLWLRVALGWVGLFAIVFYLAPMALAMLSKSLPAGAQLSLGGLIAGGLTSAIGYWSKNGDTLKKKGASLLSRWGSLVFDAIAGVVLLAILVAMSLGVSQLLQTCGPFANEHVCRTTLSAQADFLREEWALEDAAMDDGDRPVAAEAAVYDFVALHASFTHALALCALCAIIGAGLSVTIGANAFSLHGMYGNRLVRAYLGAARRNRDPHWLTGFDPRDNFRLSRAGRTRARRGKVLFPVINMALNLVQPSSTRMAWQQRKAASFTATPLHCGSVGTGYVRTPCYAGPRGMSLGRAMTISGAAASPNMGYHSSPLVTMIMTLFNVRLGWWVANPRLKFARSWRQKEFMGLRALTSEAFGFTTDDRRSVYLSDGGHFENLGLYEMIRRRCHHILVVDAGCDPHYEYADLLGAVRKIRIDFGVRVELPDVLPGQPGARRNCRMAVGRIRYSDRDAAPGATSIDGFIYILKPLLTGREPLDLGDYARSARPGEGPFPQQSTADQFFSESQFESYRMLGLQSVLEVFPKAGGGLWPRPVNPRPGAPGPRFPMGASNDAGPPPPDDETIPEPPPPPPSTGIAGMVQGVGPGVALATALTVGGTVGVVGTVKLSSNQVSLSAQDRKLLRDAAEQKNPPPVAQAPASGSPLVVFDGGASPSPPEPDAAIAQVVEQARDAAQASRKAAEAAAAAASHAAAWTARVPSAPSGPDYSSRLSDMSISLERMNYALNGTPMSPAAAASSAAAGKPASGTVVDGLNDMKKKLTSIDSAVNRRVGRTTGVSEQ